MKAKLIYKLPKESDMYKRATSIEDLYSELWGFDQYLRGIEKYNTPDYSTTEDMIDGIREEFYEHFSNYLRNYN